MPGRKALLKSDIEYEVVLIDATETPIERPKKTKILLFRQKEATYAKDTNHRGQEEKEIEANKLNSKQRQHLYCLRPDHWQAFGGGGFINKMPKNLFGLNIFTERGLHLTMNEYVLRYPKVLSNVIKILEKPCFYFKDLPLPPDSEPLIYSDVEETEYFLKHEKSALYCNKDLAMYYEKERTYSVLRLVDSKGRSKIAIVIPRKDNAPLAKK